jgi:hypothetical protein
MSKKAVAYCGYSDIAVHFNCKNLADLRSYNATVGQDYPNIRVDEKEWLKCRKRLLKNVSDR